MPLLKSTIHGSIPDELSFGKLGWQAQAMPSVYEWMNVDMQCFEWSEDKESVIQLHLPFAVSAFGFPCMHPEG